MKKRGRREKYVCVWVCACVCVCVRQPTSLRGGGREDCLHRPITKKQAFRRGPITTGTGARFHRDDAGMMLPPYWLLERQCTLQYREAVGGQQRNKCPDQANLKLLLPVNPQGNNCLLLWWMPVILPWKQTCIKRCKVVAEEALSFNTFTWQFTLIQVIVE